MNYAKAKERWKVTGYYALIALAVPFAWLYVIATGIDYLLGGEWCKRAWHVGYREDEMPVLVFVGAVELVMATLLLLGSL